MTRAERELRRRKPQRIIIGETVAIIVCIYKGKYPVSVLIDLADLDKVKSRRWNVQRTRTSQTLYAQSSQPCKIRMQNIILPGCALRDHRNGRGTDNRASNLRPATRSQNGTNTKRVTKYGFRGIYRNHGGFGAAIKHNKKRVHIGSFATEELAARAYDAKAKELFGDYAHLNFPEVAS